MICRKTEMLIQQSLDGMLTTQERAELDLHVSSCADCATAWEQYRRLSRAATAWVRRSEPEPDISSEDAFVSRVLTQATASQNIATNRAGRLRFRIAVVTSLAVLAAASATISPHYVPDLSGLLGFLPRYAPLAGIAPLPTVPLSSWTLGALAICLLVNGWLVRQARATQRRGIAR